MTVRETLNKYQAVNNLINCKLEELSYLQDLKKRLKPLTPEIIENINTKISKLNDLITSEIDVLCETRMKCHELINALPSEVYRGIFISKYLNGHSNTQLEIEFNYSERHINRLILQGILYLESLE